MGASSIRCVGMSLRGSSESMRCRRQATSYPRWRADAGGWVASLFAVLIEVYSRLAVVVSRSFQSHTALPEETGVGHSHGEHSLQMILHILRTSGLLEQKFVRRRRRRASTSRLSRWAFGCTAKAGARPGKGEETRALGFCSMLGGPGSRRPSRRPALRVCECARAPLAPVRRSFLQRLLAGPIRHGRTARGVSRSNCLVLVLCMVLETTHSDLFRSSASTSPSSTVTVEHRPSGQV